MRRDCYWGFVCLACAALLGGVSWAADEYSRYTVARVDSSDWAQLRDEDTTTDDPTTVAGLTTITALSPGRAPYVGCALRLDTNFSYATVTPLFYTVAGVFERAGTATVLSAVLVTDAGGQYSSQTVWWESGGAARCKFSVATITGTVHEVWGGTR